MSTLSFTNKSLTSGGEPTELLRELALEYLAELARMKLAELMESSSKDGSPILIVVIPHAKVQDGKIVYVPTMTNDKETK